MVTSTVNCPKIMKKHGVFTHLCHSEDVPALIELIFEQKKKFEYRSLDMCTFGGNTRGAPEKLRWDSGPRNQNPGF